MGAIILGVFLLIGVGGWYLSNSWMDADFRKPMKAVLIVVAIISVLLILGGLANLVLG